MSTLLNRASKKVTPIRVEIATVDLQVECLQDDIKQKQEEALALENEIAILQGKLRGIREIETMAREEMEKRVTTLFELRKKEEKETASLGEEADKKEKTQA